MSKGTLGQVVKRAISDAGFRRQLHSDPEGALKGFKLTADERAALRSGDASKLSSFGIDQRMSKAFVLGEGASAASKWGTGNDLAMGATMPDGGEPLISDALISGGFDGVRANDALIGEASGAKGARISDAGGSVRTTVTDGERLGQVNAAFEGGDRAAGRNALGDQHDIARAAIGESTASGVRNALGDQHDGGRSAIGGETTPLGQVNAAFEGSDSAVGTRALGDQHDVARSAMGDTTATAGRNALGDQHDGGRSAIGGEADRLSQVNAAFEGSDSAVGTRALGDQHDVARSAIGDQQDVAASASDTVFVPGIGLVPAHEANTYLVQPRSAIGDTALGSEQHAVVSSEGRDPYLSARDPGTGEFVRDIGTGEPLVTSAAAPLGPEQHAVVSSEGRDPYLSARDAGTGEFVKDIATGESLAQSSGALSSLDVSGQTRGDAFLTADEAGRDVAARDTQDFGQQSSLDVSGNTRDASAISSDAGAERGTAFMTADEMGSDAVARVVAPDPDTAITQREALDDAAMANPEGYDKADPTA